MKRLPVLIIMLLAWTSPIWSETRFGETLCNNPDYFCIKVKAGENWSRLFPNPEAKDIVRRINRMNVNLRPGMIIAVPKNLDRLTIYDVSPFPRYIESDGEKTIYVSQNKLAWAAYDEDGELLWWGPISSGTDHCSGVIGGCSTPTGSFRIIRKQDIDCISTAFPRRADGNNGGAEMPFCMHFFRGYALHGSETVPGYRASHGCVRMFTEDARWLNEEFVDVPGDGMRGTRVIIDAVQH
ncbi:L,D-transpeptidase [Legionella taurinensis]|uniref:L,D-transpeptidase n=2 Tax=Legionella taurinensis TaxID=70611 RepID=A0A3A5L670_9GAMM|nr:L,D-transpeptidase [Legionella taurinensis]MDX1836847.1 L,D-transpeptidase [Legionella taurinensis]PUT41264.1 L,D-transpeptidase [Legionella taurinensis]PUT42389.1 L,D-transpeptidase [Legionella taurinensis]PUT43915.1 L,D-transpeptidase [Legionella taurinensis]PUT47170.1 L,D-transpeptidase [Legionella taurinensis]